MTGLLVTCSRVKLEDSASARLGNDCNVLVFTAAEFARLVDTDTATVARYGVMSIPTVLLLRDGHEIARLDGLIATTTLRTASAHMARPMSAQVRRRPWR